PRSQRRRPRGRSSTPAPAPRVRRPAPRLPTRAPGSRAVPSGRALLRNRRKTAVRSVWFPGGGTIVWGIYTEISSVLPTWRHPPGHDATRGNPQGVDTHELSHHRGG